MIVHFNAKRQYNKICLSRTLFTIKFTLRVYFTIDPPKEEVNPLDPELFLFVLAHPVYKMRIIQEPNTIEL